MGDKGEHLIMDQARSLKIISIYQTYSEYLGSLEEGDGAGYYL